MRLLRSFVTGALVLAGGIPATAASITNLQVASAQAATIYDAVGDYLAGWTAGNNPNGVWTYGWSTTAGASLTLYTVKGNVNGFPQFDSWTDPASAGTVPVVYLNTGPALTAATVDSLPAGALVLHGGATGTGIFSELIWTAPGPGLFNLATTFTGRQFGLNGLVEILDISGGVQSILLSGTIADQTSQSLSQQISVNAGDKLIFAARANAGSNGDTSQLVATLTSASQSTPEPSTFGLLLLALGWVGRRRRGMARRGRVQHDADPHQHGSTEVFSLNRHCHR